MATRKFAVTANDRFIGVIQAFVACGWEPIKLFSAPVSGHMASNQAVIELARSLGMAIQLSRMDAHDMADLQENDCELLVLGSYQWRVGDWTPYVARAINFHPAPLPAYRGPYPMVQGLLDGCTSWATTCHKVAAEFDSGDILAERHFAIDPYETHETLDLKAQIETRQLAQAVAQDLDALWDNARPQRNGHYVPLWTDQEREIDFGHSVKQIARQLRAFGDFECIATVNGMRYFVRRAVCWSVPHDSPPGTLVHVDGQKYVVACQDGCVALLDWSLVPPGVRIASAARG